MKTLAHICGVALAVALFSTCLGLLAVRTLGMGTFVVTGSSMEPAISKGALVIVEPVSPTAVNRGDIITFEHYGQMTTHRVIAIDGSNAASPIFTTKGDANTVADPEPVNFPGQVGRLRAGLLAPRADGARRTRVPSQWGDARLRQREGEASADPPRDRTGRVDRPRRALGEPLGMASRSDRQPDRGLKWPPGSTRSSSSYW